MLEWVEYLLTKWEPQLGLQQVRATRSKWIWPFSGQNEKRTPSAPMLPLISKWWLHKFSLLDTAENQVVQEQRGAYEHKHREFVSINNGYKKSAAFTSSANGTGCASDWNISRMNKHEIRDQPLSPVIGPAQFSTSAKHLRYPIWFWWVLHNCNSFLFTRVRLGTYFPLL